MLNHQPWIVNFNFALQGCDRVCQGCDNRREEAPWAVISSRPEGFCDTLGRVRQILWSLEPFHSNPRL